MNSLIALMEQYRYAILFPLAAVEGPIVSLAAGFLVYLGQFQFLPTYIILLFGDLVPDTIYYFIGRYSNRNNSIQKYAKKSKRGKMLFQNFQAVEKLWEKHPRKTMFFSKLAYGLSTPFLVSAGLTQMSYKKFFSLTIPITLFQYGIIMCIGYALGPSYNVAAAYIQDAGFIIAGVLVVIIIGYIFASKYAFKKLIDLEQKEKHDN